MLHRRDAKLRERLDQQRSLTDAAQIRADEAQARFRTAVNELGLALSDLRTAEKAGQHLRTELEHANQRTRWYEDQAAKLGEQVDRLTADLAARDGDAKMVQGLSASVEGMHAALSEARTAQATAEAQAGALAQQLAHATETIGQQRETIARISRDSDVLAAQLITAVQLRDVGTYTEGQRFATATGMWVYTDRGWLPDVEPNAGDHIGGLHAAPAEIPADDLDQPEQVEAPTDEIATVAGQG